MPLYTEEQSCTHSINITEIASFCSLSLSHTRTDTCTLMQCFAKGKARADSKTAEGLRMDGKRNRRKINTGVEKRLLENRRLVKH